MEAAFTRQFRPPEHVMGYEDVLSLVRTYVETRDEASLDRAGRIVAALKPGVSAEIAQNEPWLLLEKS